MNPHSSGNQASSTKLERIARRSRADRNVVFNNLGHLIDLDLLRRCFHRLDGKKAVGIDGMSKEEYGKNLESRLRDLLQRIRKGSYHPQPARIVEIPKADGSKRPLAISCLEDKIVQAGVQQILEQIYEPIFMDCSHGFRPQRGCDTALRALDEHLMDWDCGAVLEIDLRKYFNTIPHDRMIQLLERKIQDPRFLRLIIKLLKAPTLGEDGQRQENERGSPQGSILSPLLANVYLHYVLDIWFHWLNPKLYHGKGRMVRYADDAVFSFKTLVDAEDFKNRLQERLRSFGIELNESKTQAIPNGRREATCRIREGQKIPPFTFLGFQHVWGKSVKTWAGNKIIWRLKRQTCPIRFRKKLSEIKRFIQSHLCSKDLIPRVGRIVRGYVNYFAINDNGRKVSSFIHEVVKTLFKYLNKRSQRRSFNWTQFEGWLRKMNFPLEFRLKSLFFQARLHSRKCG